MLLDLQDVQIRASIRPLQGSRIRLVLDYPCERQYRERVLTALSELLRPQVQCSAEELPAESRIAE